MKYIILLLPFALLTNNINAQKLYIAPFTGLNLSSFSYPKGGRAANSILSYPKFINLNPGLGADIIYAKGKFRHVLSIASNPLGSSFRGKVKNRENNQNVIIFNAASSDKQLTIGYQLFHEQYLSKVNSKRKLAFYYGMGAAVGFNRSEEFYKINNVPFAGGTATIPPGWFYAFEQTTAQLQSVQSGIFLMPEAGLTYYNKKKKPVVNLSLYSYLGLRSQNAYNLVLQYGQLNTSYFVEERLTLRTRGGLFGFKISFPFCIYTKKTAISVK